VYLLYTKLWLHGHCRSWAVDQALYSPDISLVWWYWYLYLSVVALTLLEEARSFGLGLGLEPSGLGLGLESCGLGLGIESCGLGLGLERFGLDNNTGQNIWNHKTRFCCDWFYKLVCVILLICCSLFTVIFCEIWVDVELFLWVVIPDKSSSVVLHGFVLITVSENVCSRKDQSFVLVCGDNGLLITTAYAWWSKLC